MAVIDNIPTQKIEEFPDGKSRKDTEDWFAQNITGVVCIGNSVFGFYGSEEDSLRFKATIKNDKVTIEVRDKNYNIVDIFEYN